MRISWSGLQVLVLGLVVATVPARAEEPGAPASVPGSGGRRVDREKIRQEIFSQLRAMRMWKLTEELKLDEATAARLFPLLSKFDDQEMEIGNERFRTFHDLKQAVNAANPDPTRIEPMIAKLLSLRARRMALEQEKMAAVRKVLTPVQMAKMMLALPRIEESFRERIRAALDETGRAEVDPGHRRTLRDESTP